jgi:microcystin degradation protein MlrC
MVKFGDGAGIRVGGVDVALIAHRTQALGTEIFTASGIDLATKKYVGVKSTNHFHAAYAPIATKVIYCNGEGPSSLDARKYPYKKVRRTIWPHAELPDGKIIV